MGFFDKLKNMKDEYDRKENARQQAMAEEHQRRQQAKEDRERALYEKLENSELISGIVDHLSTVSGFGESQGSRDSNRRQVIVGEQVILFNNYPSNTFADNLKEINICGEEVEYVFAQKKHNMLDSYISEKVGVQSSVDAHNEALQRELEGYRENKNYTSACESFERMGYEDLTGTLQKPFTVILRRKLQEHYPYAKFTEVRWNTYCAYVFEMLLPPPPPKERRSIL